MTSTSGFAVFASIVVVACTLVPSPAGAKDQRSAQSDCRREAERRGYVVLAARNYQQFKDGWSLDLQARDYRGRVSWGTCFVENRSGDVSLYGFGWGGNNPGATFAFYCASPDYKYRECQLPVDGRARLVKKKSDASCVEGRDWGQRGDRVWVDNGCRANFEVARRGAGDPAVAERACLREADRQGLRVVGQERAKPVQGGYGMRLTVRRGNQPSQPAYCTYLFSTGRASLSY